MTDLIATLQAAAGNAAGAGEYIEDLFSTYVYDGTGSAQTITNGIDLDGEGGMVWTKRRDSTTGAGPWIADTERGITKYSPTYATSTETDNTGGLSAVSSTGYTLGTFAGWNASGGEYVSWTFRKAPKFFDVVTYTGDGTSNRQIPHDLGSVPGFITVKARNFGSDPWYSFHRSLGSGTELRLSETDYAITPSTRWANTDPTDTYFVGDTAAINVSGRTYVAYLFAHNDGDGEFGENADQDIIKCGSFSTGTRVELGFEPQFLLTKLATNTETWIMVDSMRGMPVETIGTNFLQPNSSAAETGLGATYTPDATGFTPVGFTGGTHIYIAIRRGPMKTPESGTEVFDAHEKSGYTFPTTVDTGFVTDAVFHSGTTSAVKGLNARLTTLSLPTYASFSESSFGTVTFDYSSAQDGFTKSSSWGGSGNQLYYSFRRAPGFFDVVAYEGTGSATTVSHNLGVAPELMIVKRRDSASSWYVYDSETAVTNTMFLEQTTASADNAAYFGDTEPTASVFSVDSAANTSGADYIAYLFATLPGISKVGSYTGNGTSQTIDCGFSAGARFVLTKRTNTTGNWNVWDSERGIVAGNDPRLEFNTTAAEDTGHDYIDPDSSGFIVNYVADDDDDSNVSGDTYIFLAIA